MNQEMRDALQYVCEADAFGRSDCAYISADPAFKLAALGYVVIEDKIMSLPEKWLLCSIPSREIPKSVAR